MQLIFDRDLSTQRAIDVGFFGENLMRRTLNATWSQIFSEAGSVPDLGTFTKDATFTTLEAVNGGVSIPLQGAYNTVLDANAAYNAETGVYSATVVLGWQDR